MVNSESKTHAPWQKEFFKNVENFQRFGLNKARAKEILNKFLQLSAETSMPEAMLCFQSEDALNSTGVYTRRDPAIRDFMMGFMSPLVKDFIFEGEENLEPIAPLLGKYPITLISNHMSHLDAPVIYFLLYQSGGKKRQLAESLVFIAGRLAFVPDFTRLGLYMINTLLVCSKRDMLDNPGMADLMTRINMRSYRQARALQKEGKVIAIFPEGTRSRTGRLTNFVDSVYNYVINSIVLPVSLEGTDEILPTNSFLFQKATGRVTFGKPILVGNLPGKKTEMLSDDIERLEIQEERTGNDKKRFVIDSLAQLIGRNLHKHRHGTYRNLYVSKSGQSSKNILIRKEKNCQEKVVIIGNSAYSAPMASILANNGIDIRVFIKDEEKAANFNLQSADLDHYPLFKLPPNISFTSEKDDIRNATLIIQAALPWELSDYYPEIQSILIDQESVILNVIKGFTPSDSGLILDDLTQLYGLSERRMSVLAGANYPEQVLERKLTGYEMAVFEAERMDRLLKLFKTGYVFSIPAKNRNDIRGVQLGGALKSIYALGIGLIDGYYEKRFGGNCDNALFQIANEMFIELTRLGVQMGGKESTFNGLSGFSDFMMSCFGQDARERQFAHDFVQKNAELNHKSSGIFGLKMLPGLVNLDKEEFPIAAIIHRIIIEEGEIQELDELFNVLFFSPSFS